MDHIKNNDLIIILLLQSINSVNALSTSSDNTTLFEFYLRNVSNATTSSVKNLKSCIFLECSK